VRTSLRLEVTSEIPDPRLPQFTLAPGQPPVDQLAVSESDDAGGFGDLLLRGKYVISRRAPVDVAAGLGLSLPTGNDDDFHGTGTVRVQPTLILSKVLADRFEPLLNVGMDLNADQVDRSVVRWATGLTAQLVGPLSGALVFLGRHELDQQTDDIPAFFFAIERNDIFDASIGFRLLLGASGVIAANVIVPLNDDGLRADAIPTLEVEYAFDGPW
jgi:hypothetical protein